MAGTGPQSSQRAKLRGFRLRHLLPHHPNFCAFVRLREPAALSRAVLNGPIVNGPCERTAEILAYLVK
jgi:hypothetical protein